jgi:Response regulator containing CheY-like receiver, AAA-type ATPase, and DNA-binding domains
MPPRNLVVLVVDDRMVMRSIIKNMLSNVCQCTFLDATNGRDAETLLRSTKVDAVMLDWNMPDVNGLEFLKKARAVPEYKSLPIIMVTSEAAKSNVREAVMAGVTDYIIKPVNEADLLAKFKKHVLKDQD